MSNLQNAAVLIASFEGYRPVSYWDVNAWRIGYGSDTRTAAQIKVKKGDTETKADALANLAARLPYFENEILKQVTSFHWDRLPPAAQPPLLSVAYNYGDLPVEVARAVVTGTLKDIANAVRALGSDNRGINTARRHKEAFLIEGA